MKGMLEALSTMAFVLARAVEVGVEHQRAQLREPATARLVAGLILGPELGSQVPENACRAIELAYFCGRGGSEWGDRLYSVPAALASAVNQGFLRAAYGMGAPVFDPLSLFRGLDPPGTTLRGVPAEWARAVDAAYVVGHDLGEDLDDELLPLGPRDR